MSPGEVFSFDKARSNEEGPGARWADVVGDFAGEVFPGTQPSFTLQKGDTVLALGGGFAGSLEQHLAHGGCRAPMREFELPAEEWSGDAAAAMARPSPASIRQALAWAAGIHDRDGVVTPEDCVKFAFECDQDLYLDLDFGAPAPVGRKRFVERRQAIYDVLSSAFTADGLVIAPAQAEVWRDAETGLYIQSPPGLEAMTARPERWSLEVLSYTQCEADLLAAIDLVRERNSEAKVLIAVSPEPLAVTGSGQDVRIANTQAKSVLRAACGEVASVRPAVDYFPVHEAATLSHPKLAWDSDRLAPTAGFVTKAARRVLDLYMKAGAGGGAPSLKLARALLLKRKYAEAETAARALQKTGHDDVDIGMILVEALIGRFKGAEAEQELRRWIELHPDRADLRIAQARAMARSDRDRLPEAILEINSASRMPSMTLVEFRAVSELIRRKAPPSMAENIMRLAVERCPDEPEAHGFLIDVLVDRGKYGEATELLRKALTLPGAPSIMRLQLAALLIEEGQTAEAETLVRSVLAEEPANEDAQELVRRLERIGALSSP